MAKAHCLHTVLAQPECYILKFIELMFTYQTHFSDLHCYIQTTLLGTLHNF